MNQNIYYNYIYLDPRKKGQYTYEGLNFSLLYEPFYIGKGCKLKGKVDRKYHHLMPSSLNKNTFKSKKIKSIFKCGYDRFSLKQFVMQFNSNIIESDAHIIETIFIKSIGRIDLGTGTLCNHTDGGEGISNPNKLHRELLSKANKNKIHPNKGKTYEEVYGIEEAVKLKQTFGSPKESHPLWNKGHSKESRIKISEHHYDCSGANNGRAKIWKLISPTGEEFIVSGGLKQFCKEHGINVLLIRKFQNKIVTTKQKSKTNGWTGSII